MFKQDIANKQQQIKQLEELISKESNRFLLDNNKKRLDIRKNELQELKKMQIEYNLGTFDIYKHEYLQALRYFISYANTQRWNQAQRNDFFAKNMEKWEQEHIELKYASLLRKVFYSALPPPSKIQASQKVLESVESLQKYLAQDLQKAIS